jgi:uncharacterized damage-inducible protein DinB
METIAQTAAQKGISTETILEQWLGHRRVTRKVIEAYPEDKIFTYSIGGMRTFAKLVAELLTLGAPGIRGVVNGKWDAYKEAEMFTSKQEMLEQWDIATEEIRALWPQISAKRFHEMDKFFGQYEGPIYSSILYLIDNEIHHRAQAYVYLRSLGIEPPAFWDRG